MGVCISTLFDSTQAGELQDLFFVLLDKITGTCLSRHVYNKAYRDSGYVINPKYVNSWVTIQ